MKNDPLADVIDLAAARAGADAASKLAGSLQKTSDGAILPTLSNALVILAYDPALSGIVGFNAFTMRSLILRAPPVPLEGCAPLPGPYPRPWTNADVSLITAHIQRVYAPKMRSDAVEAAMDADSKQRQFHPLRLWLNNIRWDGVARLDTWLHKAFGCPDTPYHAAVGAKTLIAAVRRVRHPGCKYDTMLVVEGTQGIGKSKVVRALAADDNYSDSMPANLESKDSAMALAGYWIIEFAELQHIVRSEIETIKAFLSRGVDRYRPPYARNIIDVPRQGIVIGTTNENDYLRDTTGNRRFWPVRALWADDLWVEANRDQIWAEAAAREAAGEVIWLDDDDTRGEATEEQAGRLEQDVWTGPILSYVGNKDRTTMAQVLLDGVGVDRARQGRREQMRAASVLRANGWTVKIERGYDQCQAPMRVWYPPGGA